MHDRISRIKYNDKTCYVESFRGAQDFYNEMMGRAVRKGFDEEDIRTDHPIDRHEWRGAKSTKEAVDQLLYGANHSKVYDQLLADYKEAIRTGSIPRSGRAYAVGGGQPVVARVLTGQPNCYAIVKRRQVPKTCVKVGFDVGCAHYTSAEKYREVGTMLFRSLATMEAQGVRCEVHLLNSTYQEDARNIISMAMLAKDARQPLDVDKLGYMLTDPSFFRVLQFHWIVSHPHFDGNSTLGRALAYQWDKETLTMFYKDIHGLDAVFNYAQLGGMSPVDRREHIQQTLGVQ